MLVREVARATEEQMKKDEQEMNTWEEKNKVSDAKWLRGIVRFQNEMRRLIHHDEQAL